MNVLYGLYHPDEGTIQIDGRPVAIHSPKDAIALGIGMIHQHFMLVNSLTVTENVVLGLKGQGASLDLRRHARRIAELSRGFGFEVDPMAPVWRLPMGMRQRVEILKALYRGAKILILDEPTSVLAPGEIERFLAGLEAASRRRPHDPVHHPQARGGDGGRGSGHGDARRQGHRRGRDRRHHSASARPADGRPRRGVRARAPAWRAGRGRARGRRAARRERSWPARARWSLAHAARRRDPGDRGRRRQRPGRARRGHRGAAAAPGRLHPRLRARYRGSGHPAPADRGRHRLRAGGPAGYRAGAGLRRAREPDPARVRPPAGRPARRC